MDIIYSSFKYQAQIRFDRKIIGINSTSTEFIYLLQKTGYNPIFIKIGEKYEARQFLGPRISVEKQ